MRFWSLASTAWTCWKLTAAQDQLVLEHGHEDKGRPINIAVIGAGAAGASSAYHLSKFAATHALPVNITVFERNAYVGGRSTTVNAYDEPTLPVELGASIFVQVNSILVDAVREFNLSTASLRAATDEIPGEALGIWDGKSFVFTQSGGGFGWWDIAKLVWRYGTAPYRTLQLMKATVGKFLNMYDAPVFPFESLTQAAQDVGLLAVTAATGEQFMRENGILGTFGRDIVQASTRVNYAQNLAHIHGLEAMVCMATEGAMAVEGGNWRIFDHMIKASGATALLETAVTGWHAHENGSYTITFQSTNPDHTDAADVKPTSSQLFDAVILAAPYQFADLTISASSPSSDSLYTPDAIPYVKLHVTLLTSPHLLSPAFFNLPARTPAAPKVILTTLAPDESPHRGPGGRVAGAAGFFSISLLRATVNPSTAQPEYLYKIFSPQPPNATFLSALFGAPLPPSNLRADADADADDARLRHAGLVTWLHRKVWHSYPYEFPRVTFEDARIGISASGGEEGKEKVIGKGWYYTGGMDSFISTMETNALMGRNVAALVVREWEAKRKSARG